jgi:septal ring factor EnvC (AmiA/AmiB activator)
LGEYRVIKNRAVLDEGRMYRRGEVVELSDETALRLISDKTVVPAVDTILTKESDGLFQEIQNEVVALRAKVEVQAQEIEKLTAQLEKKDNQIANISAKKGK